MNRSKKKEIHRKEVEDDLGISRKKKVAFTIPPKVYYIVKLVLIVLIPVIYLLYSPLLIAIILLYFALIFVTNLMEKQLNHGLRKSLQISLSKIDSILCIIVVIITLASTLVSMVSTTERKSPFEGMDSEQMEEFVEDLDFDSADFKWMQVKNKIKDFGTLLTGTRVLFEEEQTFRGGFGGGRPSGFTPPSGDFELPENFTPPSGDFSPPDMNSMLGNMPFSMMFESIIKAVNTGLLFIICICGIVSLSKVRKLTKN